MDQMFFLFAIQKGYWQRQAKSTEDLCFFQPKMKRILIFLFDCKHRLREKKGKKNLANAR